MNISTKFKGLFAACVAAVGLSAVAAPTVTVDKVTAGDPWSTITVNYTPGGTDAKLEYKVAFDITAKGQTASVTNAAAKLVAGQQAVKSIDTVSLFGEEVRAEDATVKVTLIEVKPATAVQLWEGGPYFATCNVGAKAPEDYGWYFWWGDTVGYKRNAADDGWVSVVDGTTPIQFSKDNPTASQNREMDIATLRSEGWIDDSGNLAAEHDAATVKLGAPWRMMTKEEADKLVDMEICECTKVEQGGVSGSLLRGKTTGYTDKSIFIPAAGYGQDANLSSCNTVAVYWASSPCPDDKLVCAWYLNLRNYGTDIRTMFYDRSRYGGTVRPVRDTPPEPSDEKVVAFDEATFVLGPETVSVSLPVGIEGGWYVVSNLTDGVAIEADSAAPGGATYKLPVGKRIEIYVATSEDYEPVEGTNPLVIESFGWDTEITADMLPQIRRAWFRLYPEGDGGEFVAPTKSSERFLGTVLGENGVAGTVTVKMTKPNKRTGLFNVQATVKTLADRQSYTFKAKNVGFAANGGPLTLRLAGSNAKSAAHELVLTFEGDSLTGAFDGADVDGARHVFAISKHAKRDAVLSFVGAWTGAFTRPVEAEGGVGDVLGATFSAKLTKSGSASVKVSFADGKTASCSAKAEVGADGVVAVPVTVRRSAGGAYESFGFRLVFSVGADGNAVCAAEDVAPVVGWVKKTGEVTVVDELEFYAAGLQTVTAKEFKTFVVTVDPALEALLGPVTGNTLKLAASTGRISGSLKWKVTSSIGANGREKTKTVTGKATGVVVGGVGLGTVSVKLDGKKVVFSLTAVPADSEK